MQYSIMRNKIYQMFANFHLQALYYFWFAVKQTLLLIKIENNFEIEK